MTNRKALSLLFACILLVTASTAFAEVGRPLLRFPDIHGDTVAFVHGEDIWTAPVDWHGAA